MSVRRKPDVAAPAAPAPVGAPISVADLVSMKAPKAKLSGFGDHCGPCAELKAVSLAEALLYAMHQVEVQTRLSEDERKTLRQLGNYADEARERGYGEVNVPNKDDIQNFLAKKCQPIVEKMFKDAKDDCSKLKEVVNVMKNMLLVGTPLHQEGQELAIEIVKKIIEKPEMEQMSLEMLTTIQQSSGKDENSVDDKAKKARIQIAKKMADAAKAAIHRETPQGKKELVDKWFEDMENDIEKDSKDPEQIEAAKRAEQTKKAAERAEKEAKKAKEAAERATKAETVAQAALQRALSEAKQANDLFSKLQESTSAKTNDPPTDSQLSV